MNLYFTGSGVLGFHGIIILIKINLSWNISLHPTLPIVIEINART